jgi:DNA mismatch endonuclease (patch repair protein)
MYAPKVLFPTNHLSRLFAAEGPDMINMMKRIRDTRRSTKRNLGNLSAWTFCDVPPARSRNMAAIRSRNTTPERAVRSTLHKMGYRFRLHVNGLPGCPDIVLPKLHKVIFVHGCFWHGHYCRVGRRKPKANARYWELKRAMNRVRFAKARRALLRQGWSVLIVWECHVRHTDELCTRLENFVMKSDDRNRSNS